MTGFYEGQEVVTRRGKRGVVTEVKTAALMVRFGGNEFEMRPGQLVSAKSYERMMRGKPVPGQR